MNVGQLEEYLRRFGPDEEAAVTAAFPGLGGWEVTSWAVRAAEREGSPGILIEVHGADFDYPGPGRELELAARALLEREGGDVPPGSARAR